MASLPSWIQQVPGKDNTFVVDPDIFYPRILEELGVPDSAVDRYWMEVALGCMKLDFDHAVRIAGAAKPGKPVVRYVRADNGRKQRWAVTMHKPSKDEPKTAKDRGREVRKHWKRIRGL